MAPDFPIHASIPSTSLRASDATSGLPRFDNSLHGIARPVLDEAFPSVERRPFGRNCRAATADFPAQFVAGLEAERIADLLRDRRPAFAGHDRSKHGAVL